MLLTRENGRFSAFARGARRLKSPLSAVTEPFCYGEFYVFRGRDSYTVEEVKINDFFPELRKDLDRLYMGMYFCEVSDYFTREGMEARDELELLYRAMSALRSDNGIDIRLTRHIFELRLLSIAGYSPRYDEEKKVWRDDLGEWKLSQTASYTIGQILTRPMRELFSFMVSEPVLAELGSCVTLFLKRNTDRQFRSIRALEALQIQ